MVWRVLSAGLTLATTVSLPVVRGPVQLYLTESPSEAERILTEVPAPTVRRPVDALCALSLPIGSAEVCAERLSEFARGAAERIFVWPLGDELRQLQLFAEHVTPHVRDT